MSFKNTDSSNDSPVLTDLARRRSLLTAALGFALLRTRDGSAPPEVQTVRTWLDTWRGVGDVVTGMNRQGFMLHLSNVDASSWRATFDRAPLLSVDGFGTGPTPWWAVQVAAWEALRKSPGQVTDPVPARDNVMLQ